MTRIIHTMRHWLLILMIALLPLRGWAGVAMTVSMQMPAGIGAAAHCEEHTASDATDPGAGQQAHSLCDVCNGPAMTAGEPAAQEPAPLPQSRTVPGRVAFISADTQRGHKPPIA
jgi:hypothetical protein